MKTKKEITKYKILIDGKDILIAYFKSRDDAKEAINQLLFHDFQTNVNIEYKIKKI